MAFLFLPLLFPFICPRARSRRLDNPSQLARRDRDGCYGLIRLDVPRDYFIRDYLSKRAEWNSRGLDRR